MFKKAVFPIVIIFAALTSCHTMRTAKTINENIEWTRTWITGADKTDLPHVLLIGDSHVEAYYSSVEKELKGIAYCSRFTTSKSMGDPVLPGQIEGVLRHYKFDVISFNNGLHGRGYTAGQYAAFIPVIYKLLQKYGHPKIQWVNTTAERDRKNIALTDSFNINIVKRNQYVEAFARREHIPLIDNYSLSVAHPEFYKSDGVHFTERGIAAESRNVTAGILALLKK